MALPPEPLAEVLPQAARVLVAEVSEATGEKPADPAPGAYRPIGSAGKLPEQQIRLKVTSSLRGPTTTEVVCLKPAGAYWLIPGNKGPFLLDNSAPVPKILGRYGPDTWPLAAIEKALKGS